MSPWLRIDENAMDHPKFIALSANAWRLWCEGCAYCQKHLTDGVIGLLALKGFRYYSAPALKLLLIALVPGKGPCWHQEADGTIHVHDYLDYNDSREEVLKAREDARERKKRFASRNASGNASVPDSENAFLESERTPNLSRGGDYVSSGSSGTNGRISSHARGTNPSDFAPEVRNRVADFIERYKALYVKHRKGAHYVGNPQKDFPEAALLCETWDDERLDTLAHAFLVSDNEFAQSGSRTLAQFRSMASWCDGKLRERGL